MASKITTNRIFKHELDDKTVEITKLSDDVYAWLQYGATAGDISVYSMETYSRDEILKMIEFFEPCSKSISALELFEKFDNV